MSDRNFQAFQGNPRKISQQQKKDLESSLRKYGDLSGVVWNRRSGKLVGGNQRSTIFDIKDCEIDIKEEYKKADPQGTVAIGFIVWEGRKYGYREVDWSEDWEKEANIFANKLGGEWDMDVLKFNFPIEQLLEWGFTNINATIGDAKEAEVVEFEKSVQMQPAMEYIVIVCTPGSDEFDELKDWLKLKRVRRGGYKKGSAFDAIGLERVIYFDDFKKRIQDGNSDTK